jgi:hypothetical protein
MLEKPTQEARSGRIARLPEALADCLTSESALGYRWAAILLSGFFALVAALILIWGTAPISGPWDMGALLDAGWRIVNGQIPHADFHTPIGPVTYLLVAFGLKVAAPSVSAVAYGALLTLAILLPGAWYVAARRLPVGICFLYVLFLGVLLVAPRPLGYAIRDTTYAMIYNRQGYALTSVLLIQLFLGTRKGLYARVRLDGALTGVLLGVLLYCKVTYFAFAAIATVAALVVQPRTVTYIATAAMSVLAVVVAFYLSLHISLIAYLGDLAAAGAVQSRAMRLHLLLGSLSSNIVLLYLIVAALFLMSWVGAEARSLGQAWKLWFVAALVLATALGISSGNAAQGGGVDDPLIFIAALLLLEMFRRANPGRVVVSGTSARFAYTAIAFILMPLSAGPIIARDLASMTYSTAWNWVMRPAYPITRRLHSTNLRDFYVPESTQHITAYWPAREHPARLNDGIDLLRRNIKPGERVTTLAFANPFSYALGIPPAHDGPLWWDLNFSFDATHFPPVESVLGDASLVMVPTQADRSNGGSFAIVDALLLEYGNYLHQNFDKIAQTDTWTLYRRRNEPRQPNVTQ